MNVRTLVFICLLATMLTACVLNNAPPETEAPAMPTSAVALQQVAPTTVIPPTAPPEPTAVTVIEPLAPASELEEVEPTLPPPPPTAIVEATDGYPAPTAIPEQTESVDVAQDESGYPAPVTAVEPVAQDAVDVSAESAYPPPPPALPTPEPASYPEPQNEAAATDTPVEEPTATPLPPADAYPAPSDEPVNEQAEEVAQHVYPELVGMMIKDSIGVWEVAADGTLQQRLTTPSGLTDAWQTAHVAVSADRTEIGIVIDGNLTRYSPSDQTLIPLSNTPVREECCFLNWLAPDRWLLAIADGGGFGNSGRLNLLNATDGSMLEFSEQSSFGMPDVNGDLIAFDEAGVARIATVADGVLTDDELGAIGKVWSVSWSPSGDQLAWLAQQAEGLMSLTVFDRTTQETTYHHLYTPIVMEGWYPSRPAWQPNGGWIAFETIDADSAEVSGIWLVDPNTDEERFLGPGTNPRWNSDGTVVAWQTSGGIEFLQIDTNFQSATGLAGDIVTWE